MCMVYFRNRLQNYKYSYIVHIQRKKSKQILSFSAMLSSSVVNEKKKKHFRIASGINMLHNAYFIELQFIRFRCPNTTFWAVNDVTLNSRTLCATSLSFYLRKTDCYITVTYVDAEIKPGQRNTLLWYAHTCLFIHYFQYDNFIIYARDATEVWPFNTLKMNIFKNLLLSCCRSV